MLIAELGLAPASKRALHDAGITGIDQLQRPANELLDIEPITGAVLYDIVRCLHAHKLGLHTNPRLRRPTEADIEILRLRVVKGLSLRTIALISDVSPERIRQRLNLRFGLSGEPQAAQDQRRFRPRRPEWERIIGLRLSRANRGLPMEVLLRGFAEGPLGTEARAAIKDMEAKGLLTVHAGRIEPTETLLSWLGERSFHNRTGRGTRSRHKKVEPLTSRC